MCESIRYTGQRPSLIILQVTDCIGVLVVGVAVTVLVTVVVIVAVVAVVVVVVVVVAGNETA